MRNNIMITTAIILISAGFGYAQAHDGQHRMKNQMHVLGMAEELGLNESQTAKLRDIHHSDLKKQIALDAEIKIAELGFKKMMMEDASEKELIKEADNISSKMAEKRKLHIKKHFRVKNVLTAEQWNSMKKLMSKGMMGKKTMMKKMGEDHHKKDKK